MNNLGSGGAPKACAEGHLYSRDTPIERRPGAHCGRLTGRETPNFWQVQTVKGLWEWQE